MNQESLRNFLDQKVRQYDCSAFIDDDPVSIPHLFSRKEDIEISAFLTATISWGQRKSIIQNARSLMERMDFNPFSFTTDFSAGDLRNIRSFCHRTFNGEDTVYFIKALRHIYQKHGGLESVFRVSVTPGQEVRDAIISARKVFFSLPHQDRHEKHFSDPLRGSAAKRLNMFLRWMVRNKSGADLGIWKKIASSQLLCPLDTHSGRVARKLGLLNRNQNDWKAVDELTARLREFDPEDPVKYDYALFGLGVFEKF